MKPRSFLTIVYNIVLVFLPGNRPDSFGSQLRVWVLKALHAKIGKRVSFSQGVRIAYPHNLEVGDDSGLGVNLSVHCHDFVRIGRRVLIGPNVMIFTADHLWDIYKKTYFKSGLTSNKVY